MDAAAFASALGATSQAEATMRSAFHLLGKSPPAVGACSAGGATRSSSENLIAQALNQALTGERKPIPTWSGSASTLRSWLKLLALWEYESQVPPDRRGVKLLQSFPEGSQPRRIADTVPTETLLSSRGYGAILSALYDKYAPYLEASGPQAIDRFLFEGERGRGESFASYIAAKELARQEMETQLGEVVSERLCGRILLKQANLSEVQRELVMLRGPTLRTFAEVSAMLRPLDRPEMLVKATEGGANKHFLQHADGEEVGSYEGDSMDEWDDDDEAESDVAPDNQTFLYLEDREYSENEALSVYAYQSAYRHVRKELQKRKNERGFSCKEPDRDGRRSSFRPRGRPTHDRRGSSAPSALSSSSRFKKGKGKGKKKASEDELLARTRCFNCNELGHLSRDCPLRDQRPTATPGRKSFVVLGNHFQSQSTTYMMQATPPRAENRCPSRLHVYAGVTCKFGEALVDTAAEDPVIGDRAMKRLQQALSHHNLQPIPVSSGGPLPGAGGIGGLAQVTAMLEVPVGIAGINGVLRFTVLKDTDECETPPLLPASYLESVGAVINFQTETYETACGRTSTMRRLPSGHRAISVMDFDPSGWNLPPELRKHPHVDPFQMPDATTTANWAVTVWLCKGTRMHNIESLRGPRRSLVTPDECAALSRTSLTMERTTHLVEHGRHPIIIHDRWNLPQQDRTHVWHGTVIFHEREAEVSFGGQSSVEVSSASPGNLRGSASSSQGSTGSTSRFDQTASSTATGPKQQEPKEPRRQAPLTFDLTKASIHQETKTPAETLEARHQAFEQFGPELEEAREEVPDDSQRSLCARRARTRFSESLPQGFPSMLKWFLGFLQLSAFPQHVFEGASGCHGENSEGPSFSLIDGDQAQSRSSLAPDHLGLAHSPPNSQAGDGGRVPHSTKGGIRPSVSRDGEEPSAKVPEEVQPRENPDGHRASTKPVNGPEEVELCHGGLRPRPGLPETSSRTGSVLVHLPSMRVSVGKAGSLRQLHGPRDGGQAEAWKRGVSQGAPSSSPQSQHSREGSVGGEPTAVQQVRGPDAKERASREDVYAEGETTDGIEANGSESKDTNQGDVRPRTPKCSS